MKSKVFHSRDRLKTRKMIASKWMRKTRSRVLNLVYRTTVCLAAPALYRSSRSHAHHSCTAGAPDPGSPRTGLSPWGGDPDFRIWDCKKPISNKQNQAIFNPVAKNS